MKKLIIKCLCVILISLLFFGCASPSFKYISCKTNLTNSESISFDFSLYSKFTNLKQNVTNYFNSHNFYVSSNTNLKINLTVSGWSLYSHWESQGGGYGILATSNTRPNSSTQFAEEDELLYEIKLGDTLIVKGHKMIFNKSLSTLKELPNCFFEEDLPEYLFAICKFAIQDFSLLKTGSYWQKNLMLIWISEHKTKNALPKIKELLNSTNDKRLIENCKRAISALD